MAELSRICLMARRGQLAALAEAMHAAFELALPEAGWFTAASGAELLWTGPGRFILQGRQPELFERAAVALSACAGVVDVSDSLVSYRAAGPSVREALRRLLPLDLDGPALAPGRLAHTVAAHMPVQLRTLDDTPSYELLCRRSEAESFRHHLERCLG